MTSALQNEAEWLPQELDELPDALRRLRERLAEAGRSPAEVQGITGWIVGKALGERDGTSGQTRARYRRILRDLGETDPTGSDPVYLPAATRTPRPAHNHRDRRRRSRSVRSPGLDPAADLAA